MKKQLLFLKLLCFSVCINMIHTLYATSNVYHQPEYSTAGFYQLSKATLKELNAPILTTVSGLWYPFLTE